MNDNIFTKCDISSDSVHNVKNVQSARNVSSLRSSSKKQIPSYKDKAKDSKVMSTHITRQAFSETKKYNMIRQKEQDKSSSDYPRVNEVSKDTSFVVPINKNNMVKDGNFNMYETSSCHKTLQEKLEAIDKNYPLEDNLDTERKCQILLNNIQDAYTDKESLQDMLDETLVLLKEQENDNDKLKIRCREYFKIIEKQYNKIKQLEQLLEEYDDEVFKKNFIKKYI